MRRFQVGVTEARRGLIVQAAAAAGALLIFISLFLPWYSVGLADSIKALAQTGVESELESAQEFGVVSGDLDSASELLDTTVDYSGWASLEFADAFLLFVAIAARLRALGGRRAAPTPRACEPGDALALLGLLAVLAVLVLLITKNSVLGMLESTIASALDLAGDLGADIELLSISPDIGLWLALLGALLTLVAGVFHGLVDPTGVDASRTTGTGTTASTTTAPTETAPAAPVTPPPAGGTTGEPPTTPQR